MKHRKSFMLLIILNRVNKSDTSRLLLKAWIGFLLLSWFAHYWWFCTPCNSEFCFGLLLWLFIEWVDFGQYAYERIKQIGQYSFTYYITLFFGNSHQLGRNLAIRNEIHILYNIQIMCSHIGRNSIYNSHVEHAYRILCPVTRLRQTSNIMKGKAISNQVNNFSL